jgi:hypothetical protein
MRYRHRSLKPTAALWAFVLGTDAVLALAGAGTVVLWTASGLATAVLVGTGVWILRRRTPTEPL